MRENREFKLALTPGTMGNLTHTDREREAIRYGILQVFLDGIKAGIVYPERALSGGRGTEGRKGRGKEGV